LVPHKRQTNILHGHAAFSASQVFRSGGKTRSLRGQAAPGVADATARPLHGQAALDFLMTYGWALIMITICVAALYSMGVFDASTFIGSRASGFSQMTATDWMLRQDGMLVIRLKNNAGTDVNITRINATYQSQTAQYNATTPISNGQLSGNIAVGSFAATPRGTGYSVQVAMAYTDIATGYTYVDSGTLTGKVA
jgi:hypothetical protein